MNQWKRDALLILALLLAAAILWLFLRPGDTGAYAIVTLRGEEIARYSLTENKSVTIGTDDYNVLTISDGTVCVSDANCGDHTCIHTGQISREGEQIICLPHELVIEITGGESTELDASTH